MSAIEAGTASIQGSAQNDASASSGSPMRTRWHMAQPSALPRAGSA